MARFMTFLTVCLVASAAVAAARPMGSERTLTAAGADPNIPANRPDLPSVVPNVPCSPFAADSITALGFDEFGSVANPDSGKQWLTGVVSGGEGLSGPKCAAAFHNCATCSTGYKSCVACADFTSVGGFKYELHDGICAVRIHFDDIALNAGQNAIIPANYKGFQWKNMAVYNPTNTKPSGYVKGVVSTTNVALNPTPASPSEVTALGFTFDLVSLHATGAWNNGLTVTFTGYAAGVAVNTKTVTVGATASTLVTFGAGWEGLDKLTLASSGGVKETTYTSKGYNVALDDILVA